MQGNKINNIILGIYYYECIKDNCFISFKDIALMFNKILPDITDKIIEKTFNSIKEFILEPSLNDDEINGIEKKLIQDYFGENDNENNNQTKIKMLAIRIVENINGNYLLQGKNPKTVAGLALDLSYKLLNNNIDDKKKFYSMFCVKNTIKNTYEEIRPFLNKIVPPDYKFVIIK